MLNSAFNLLITSKSGKHILRVSLEADSCSACNYYLFNYGPGVESACNINEYQESSWGLRWPAYKDGNLMAICELIVYIMWEP
jgi:hypothetical protein